MFNQPPMQLGINFHPTQPRQDPWFNNWNIGISPGMKELPVYPKAEDQTTGGDIARAWHQMQKDFVHRTMNENFPSYKPHKPQPFNANQSYDDYMNEHKLVLRNLDPFFLNNYQRAKPQAFSLFGKEEAQDQAAPTPDPSTASILQPQEPSFFKPLDEMLKEVEERNARGEFFDESGKWVKREKVAGDYIRGNTELPPIESEKSTTSSSRPLQTLFSREDLLAKALGQAEEGNPKPHVPGPNSGITLGRGNDSRGSSPAKLEKDLIELGYPRDQVKDYIKAAYDPLTEKPRIGSEAIKARDQFMRLHPDFKVTPQQAEALYQKNIGQYTSAADRLEKGRDPKLGALKDNEHIVMSHYAYNKGPTGMLTSKAAVELRKGNIKGAAEAIRQDYTNDSIQVVRSLQADLLEGKISPEEYAKNFGKMRDERLREIRKPRK
ncbi:MAG: hypothetical protein AB7G80_09240 [Dongiaceae bacterium]